MAGERTIDLDKRRTLKFGITDVAALERDLGYGVDELQARGQRMTALIALLFYGLRHEDAALTQRQVERKLQRFIDKGGDLVPIVDATYSALYDSGVYGKRLQEVSRRTNDELREQAAAPAGTADDEGDDDQEDTRSSSAKSSTSPGDPD